MPAARSRLHAGAAGSGGMCRDPVQLRDPAGAAPVTQQVSPSADSGWSGRARAAARAQARRWEQATLGRFWSRLLELEFVDRSVALAAKAVVSFFPLLIVAAALSPPSARRSLVDSIAARFGVRGDAFAIMKDAFASPDQTRAATGLLGTLLALAYAVSFTTAQQRVYLRAWRRPSGGGVRNKGRGAVWIAGVVALLLLLGSLRRVVGGPPGTISVLVLGVVGSVLSWWWTARLMLRGEVRWRPLLPTAVVTGVGSWAYTLAATVWMPRAVSKHYQQFGSFGIALDFVSWFTGFAFLIVGAAVLGPVLTEGDNALGRWLRGADPSPLTPSAPPALPAPPNAPRLSDAFGLGDVADRGESLG